MRVGHKETEVLLCKIEESRAEIAQVIQDKKMIKNRNQLQLQVIGRIYKIGGAPCYSRSACSEISQP